MPIMTKKCLPKHKNPLKAATVFISGLWALNIVCVAFTRLKTKNQHPRLIRSQGERIWCVCVCLCGGGLFRQCLGENYWPSN